MSVATFDDTMADLTCEIDDRNIYNDIRSEIDMTVTEVITDTPNLYGWALTDWTEGYLGSLENGQQRSIILYPRTLTHVPVSNWREIRAIFLYHFPTADNPCHTEWLDCLTTVTASDDESCTVLVTNNTGYSSISEKEGCLTRRSVYCRGKYTFLSKPSTSHKETQTRTITLQETDAASIQKYGRRTMSLVWPLGQSQQQMEALLIRYIGLYSEPKPYLNAVVVGDTDAKIAAIFTIKLSDRVTIASSRLGVNQDFFVNTIDISHDTNGLPIATYVLEEIAAIQATALFTLDTSVLDGAHILG